MVLSICPVSSWLANRLDTAVSPSFSLFPDSQDWLPPIINPSTPCASTAAAVPYAICQSSLCARGAANCGSGESKCSEVIWKFPESSQPGFCCETPKVEPWLGFRSSVAAVARFEGLVMFRARANSRHICHRALWSAKATHPGRRASHSDASRIEDKRFARR